MTIKNILRSVAVVLLAASITSSCIEKDNSTGASLLPGDHIISLEKEIFDLPVQMKLSDSMQTGYTSYLTIGSINDADLGLVQASTAIPIRPTSLELSYGDNPQVKSFKAYITVDDKTFFKDEDAYIPQNFRVHKLLKYIDSTVNYSNSLTESDYDPASLETSGNVFFGGDSLVIELSHQYAQELLSANQEERDSVELFQKRFNGLYISADPQPENIHGGRINLITPSNIYFLLTYRHIDAANSIDKDSTISYMVDESGPNLNRFQHQSATLENNNPQDKIFMEGLAGLKPYIDFTQIKNNMTVWAAQNSIDLSRLIISKAEIQLPFEYPDNYKDLHYYPTQIFINTRTDVSGRVIYDPIADISLVTNNGYINRSLKHYSLDISSYLQKILSGEYTGKQSEAYVAPIFQTSDYYSGAVYYYLQNYLYSKAILNGNGSERNPKLILTYAILP